MSPEWNATLLRLMLESSLRVCLLAGAVGGILLLARVRSGSVRHAAWSAVLGAMLLMPVLPYWVPAIDVPVPFQARRVEAIPAAIESIWIEPNEEFTEPLASAPTPAALTTSARAPGPTASPPGRAIWPLVLVGIYAVGTLFLLSRLLLGWRAVRRIVRGSQEINRAARLQPCETRRQRPDAGRAEALSHDSRAVSVRECAVIATPMTVGIFASKILLPSRWTLWPEEKLRAVLAHELAHVRRRDPLTALLARLNLCLFWFHPVAWWLEKKLATTAEHACDEAGVRVMGEKRRYAEILLDMAEAVRRAGGRFSWDGVGVDGSGLLGQRIDRVLRGELFREVSMTRKAIVALSCAVAIFIVVACRQQSQPPAPLKPDPTFAAEQTQQKAERELYNAADAMDTRQVADLEATLRKTPEDLAALKKLLIFYRPVKVKVNGGQWAARCAIVLGEKECVAARRPHILWLIEHHPDNELAGSWAARIFITLLDPLPDPAGYEQAKKLWLAQIARPDVSVAVLKNAAWFFEVPDKPLDEKILLRLQTMDPKGHWSDRLGRLYAHILVGSNASTPLNVVWTVTGADAHSDYAQEIRRKLAESTDTELLTAAGRHLVDGTGQKLDWDPVALGKSYLERALRLNPQDAEAHGTLVRLRVGERNRRLFAALKNVPRESQYQVVSAMPEAERFEFLPQLADLAYWDGNNADYQKHDKAAAKAGFERARNYAQHLLDLAPKFRGNPDFGAAIYSANITLGTIAMRNGDKKTAIRYLLEASKAPPSEELAYYGSLPFTLLNDPLRYGERDPVVEFLDRYAQLSVREKQYALDSAAKIRQGVMPLWYQYQATRTK